MSKKYDGIDFLKLIGSIFVFTMHLELFSGRTLNLVIQLFSRWAVPFFFIISAFFFFRKAHKGSISLEALILYVKRILLLYVSWMVINIPSIIYKRIIIEGGLSLNVLIGFIKNCLLSSSFTGSWYLLSSVFSAVLIYFFSKRLSNTMILLCTFPLFFICTFTSVYGNMLPKSFMVFFGSVLCFPLNIFTGCFYYAIGKCVADNYNRIKHLAKWHLIVLLVFSYFAYFCEVYFAKSLNWLVTTDVSLFIPLVGLTVALLGLSLNIKINNSVLLRKISTIIYCAQSNILLIGDIIRKAVHTNKAYYIIKSFIMTIFVTIVLLLQKKAKWKAVQYLT